MEQRYQVFISSTFVDLIDERREVIEALLEMDAIPAGMELFAAGNTDQWTLIKQVIDQSDYYLVIVGGRYGSTTAEGISYTEMEYDYAVEQGIPVMGFVHGKPDDIPAGRTELDPEARKKLDAFRTKVKQKIVKQYTTPAELGGVVSRGLIKLQRDFPRPGWVRGDMAMTPETEARIAEMRAELAELRQAAAEKSEAEALPKIEGLASGDDPFDLEMEITGEHVRDRAKPSYQRKNYLWTVGYETNWNEILQQVGPSLMDEASETEIRESLQNLGRQLIREQPDRTPDAILEWSRSEISGASVDDVLVQLFALDLISHGKKKRTMSDRNRYWMLTGAGQDQVMRLRALREPTPDERRERRRTELESLTVPRLRVLALDHSLDGKGVKPELVAAILGAEGHASA
ncbi:DUF4062 domain-containing protein [uncultured Schumannella sp.]|uniref:DUF4062 domain-containing protein n=1 Tax=uncultured Schumannella sp. TaxID=1195956 RepID=UPI0025E4C30D|nr:DUF4062 domain-containing protein [uncultured Schumannella sp.]